MLPQLRALPLITIQTIRKAVYGIQIGRNHFVIFPAREMRLGIVDSLTELNQAHVVRLPYPPQYAAKSVFIAGFLEISQHRSLNSSVPLSGETPIFGIRSYPLANLIHIEAHKITQLLSKFC